MSNKELYIDKVTKYFEQPISSLLLFDQVTVTFKPHTTYAITGISGTGKSTFMHLLAGIEEPSSGAIYYDGHNIFAMSDDKRRIFLNKTIGIVFQQPYLIRELSILENVIIPGLIAHKDPEWCTQHAHMLLKAVGISEKAYNKPGQLSGGQQQRAALARALFNEPAFLLADEPTGSLDEQTGMAVIDLLRECQDRWHMTLIISTHDAAIAQQMDVRYLLAHGTLVQQG